MCSDLTSRIRRSNFTSQLLADLSLLFDMRILLAGVLGGIAMFISTSDRAYGAAAGESWNRRNT